MKISKATQRKIDELRRLEAIPYEPPDRYVRRIMIAFFDAMKRDGDLEQLREDFAGIDASGI